MLYRIDYLSLSTSYPWQVLRKVLLELGFTEILTADDKVVFFQHPERGLVELRKFEAPIDMTLIPIISQHIKLSSTEFIKLCEKNNI